MVKGVPNRNQARRVRIYGAKAAGYVDAFMDVIRRSNADRLLKELNARGTAGLEHAAE